MINYKRLLIEFHVIGCSLHHQQHYKPYIRKICKHFSKKWSLFRMLLIKYRLVYPFSHRCRLEMTKSWTPRWRYRMFCATLKPDCRVVVIFYVYFIIDTLNLTQRSCVLVVSLFFVIHTSLIPFLTKNNRPSSQLKTGSNSRHCPSYAVIFVPECVIFLCFIY